MSTSWGGVARVEWVDEDTDYVYRLASSSPSAPTGGTVTESHTPSGWQRTQPSATTAQSAYRAERTRTYRNDVFESATSWGGVARVEWVDEDTDYVYRLASSSPSAPTGGTVTESHTPSGWQRTQPCRPRLAERTQPSATTAQSAYRAERTRTYRNDVFESATSWGGVTRVEWVTTDTDYVYRLASSTPSTPSGGTTTETHTPSDWQRTKPSATTAQSVYRAERTRTYRNDVFESATSWGGVARVEWVTTDTDYVYRLASSSPSAPTGGTVTESHTPSGWQRTQPSATTAQSAYRAERTRTYRNDVFESATSWGGVARVEWVDEDTDYVYRLASSSPSAPTGGTVTESHTPSGWQRTQPSATTAQSAYRAERTRTYRNDVFESATAWGGVTRVEWVTTDTDYVYRLEPSTPSTPSGGTTTETHTPSDWQRTKPSATTAQSVYRAQRTRSFRHTPAPSKTFISATAWGGVTRVEWFTTDTDYVYRLASSAPSAPTGGTSTEAHKPNGWERTKPSATTAQSVYRAQRTRSFLNTSAPSKTFTSATAWGGVTEVEWFTTDTDYVYRLASSTPSTPTGGTTTETYTPSGWQRTKPSATTQAVYRAQRTRSFLHTPAPSKTFTSATAWGGVTEVESAALTVTVSGPTSMSGGQISTFIASVGGTATGSITYSWSASGAGVLQTTSTASSVSVVAFSFDSGPLTVSVSVTRGGLTATDSLEVTVF